MNVGINDREDTITKARTKTKPPHNCREPRTVGIEILSNELLEIFKVSN